MVRRTTYVLIGALVFLLLTKTFTRILFYEGEAGSGRIVLTYVPSLSTFLYSRGSNTYEASFGDHVNLEEGGAKKETRRPIGYPLVTLASFDDGDFAGNYYYFLFVEYFIQLLFLLCVCSGAFALIGMFQRTRQKQGREDDG
jgi:uncharacterized membrane protein